jgi:hypothetical protein
MKKGEYQGKCNRAVCNGIATEFNYSTLSFYCESCAYDIQFFENGQPEPEMIFAKFFEAKESQND